MRPNFLLIITDQHRAVYLGCTGHPVLKTPHIDSIAARGRPQLRFARNPCDCTTVDGSSGSIATDRCAPKIAPCPQCPESDGWPSKCRPSRRATSNL